MPADSSAAPESGPDSGVTERDTTFAALGVPTPLVKALADDGITTPFPVQTATLPDALAGRDILGRAQTGSGKTLGFSLPLVSRLAGGSTRNSRPRGLVLVPTRELATQVTDVLKPLARSMGLSVTTIFGGVAYGAQVNALQRRTDIVVATPGRLADLISQRECDLSDVEVTVIDEADQMADLGFLPIVRRLLETTPDGGQRMLFSATLDAAIDVLARRFLTDPVLHSVDENSSPAEIEHHVITLESTDKVAVLAALAGGEKRSLVFTRTKHGAERLARQLTQAGIPAAELHGNLRQGARTRNLAAFSTGVARVMVATDIAARGIHIDGIDLVIHADPPTEHKAYVHRSGRTARGGADGVVVTLQTRAQAHDVTAMMRKADIIPHPAVVADVGSPVLAEIAGPPAPRVTVDRKVAELVQPEDRLARNDGTGVGRPRKGRGQDGRPGNDRFRGRAQGDRPRSDQGRRDGAQGSQARRDRSEFTGLEVVRTERSAPGERDRDDRNARFGSGPQDRRDSRPERGPRFGRDDRSQRGGQGQRDERAGRPERDFGERREVAPRDSGSRDFVSRDSGSRDSGGRDFGRRDSGSRDSGNRDSGGRDFGSRGSDNRDFGRRDSGSRDSGSRDSGSRDFGSRGSDNRDFGRRDSGSRDSGSRDSGNRDSGSRDFGSRGSDNRDFGRRDSGSRDSGSRDSGNRDSGGRDFGSRDFGSRGSGSRGSDNRNSGNQNGGDRDFGARPGRRVEQGSNDWYPRTGGGSTSAGRRPGPSWSPNGAAGQGGRTDRARDDRGYGNRGSGPGQPAAQDDRSPRGERPTWRRDDRPSSADRSFRSDRPARDGHASQDGPGAQRARTQRPGQAVPGRTGRAGGSGRPSRPR